MLATRLLAFVVESADSSGPRPRAHPQRADDIADDDLADDLADDDIDDIAFVDKPAGMLVHSSAWAGPPERSLVDDAEILLGAGWHPLHRLDRQTSGVVAFAREGTVPRWQAAMAHADKRYWALVRGHVHLAIDVDHALRDDDAPKDSAPREARSRITPLLRSEVERCSLVEVRLLTGRRHQARRHLKHVSHPVIGDASHGKGPLNRAYRARWGVPRMALHARSLAIPTSAPVAHERHTPRVVRATAPLPDDLRAPLERLFGADALDALLGAAG